MKKTEKALLKTLTLILLLFPSFATQGTEEPLRLYNFELIVFKYKELDYFRSETWDEDWEKIDVSNSIDFHYTGKRRFTFTASHDDKTQNTKTKLSMAKLFKPIGDSEKTLTNSVEAIKNSKRYELLAYLAWQQPGLDDNTAIPIRVRSLQDFSELEPIHRHIILNDETQSDDIQNPNIGGKTDSEIPLGHDDQYELDGTVKIVMSRFLHVFLDLRLFIPVTLESMGETEEEGETPDQAYRIKLSSKENPDAGLFGVNFRDHRRMRSKELHHIDHPLLGAVILATPVQTNQSS